MTDNTQTQFKVEGQPVFPMSKENDNSSASSTGEETNINQTGSSNQDNKGTENKNGGVDNFADHPRWKERESDWTKRFNEQEERHVKELATFRSEIDEKFKTNSNSNQSESVEVPSWFGGDEEAWKGFMTWNEQQVITKAKELALKDIESKTKAEQKAIDDATQYFNDEVKSIENDKTLNPQGQEIDRNKLLKFALENDLVNSKGQWNYRAAFKTMGADKVFKAKQALNERQQIANATISDNGGESGSQNYATSDTFKKDRPW